MGLALTPAAKTKELMVHVLLHAIAFLLGFVAPGWAILGPLRRVRGLRLDERVFICVLLGVLAGSAVSLGLAVAGQFSGGRMAAALALCALGAWGVRRHAAWSLAAAPCPVRRRWVLPLLVVIACGLLGRPHEHIGGGWDAGVYVQTGARIEGGGAINYVDSAFAALPAAEQALFIHTRGQPQRFPGFRVIARDTGAISPQFYHAYPCWLAVARWVGGDRAMLYVNTLFGVLALVAVYLFAVRVLGERTAAMAGILLGVNVVQIWFVRLSTSETLAQCLIWSGLYLWALHEESRTSAWGVLSAACFGLALVTKISAVLLLPGLGLVMLYRARTGCGRRDLPMATVLAVCTAVALLYNRYVAVAYIDLTRYAWFFARQHAVVLGVVTAALLAGWRVRRRGRPLLREALHARWVRGVAAAIVAGLAVWAYAVRPEAVAAGEAAGRLRGDLLRRLLSDGSAFREMAWFVTRPGLGLAVTGMVLMIRGGGGAARAAMVLLVLTESLVFFASKRIEPFYMVTLRRYVPVVVPGLAVCLAFAADRLTRRGGRYPGHGRYLRWAGWGLVAFTALVPLWRGRHVVRQVDFRGLLASCARIERWEALPADARVVCDGYWLAAPMHFLHGWNTLAVSDSTVEKMASVAQAMRRWREAGTPVYYLTYGGRPVARGLTFRRCGQLVYASDRLEHSIQRYPRQKVPRVVRIALYHVESEGPGRALHGEVEIPVGWNWIGIGPGFSSPRRIATGVPPPPDAPPRLGRDIQGAAELLIPRNGDPLEMTLALQVSVDACPPGAMTVYRNEVELGRIALQPGIDEYRMGLPAQPRAGPPDAPDRLRFVVGEGRAGGQVRVCLERVRLAPMAAP